MYRMTKLDHFLLVRTTYFLPIRTSYTGEDYAELFIQEIVKLHGALVSIISYQGT